MRREMVDRHTGIQEETLGCILLVPIFVLSLEEKIANASMN